MGRAAVVFGLALGACYAIGVVLRGGIESLPALIALCGLALLALGLAGGAAGSLLLAAWRGAPHGIGRRSPGG